MSELSVSVDGHRIGRELEQLATFSDGDPPGVTRVVYTDADLRARVYLKELCRGAGLAVREDAIGNLFAGCPGSDPKLPAVGTGSHIDAIPHSGKYDGTVGVLGGLEAIRSLQAAGFRPRRSIELLMFTSEEPTRFGLGCIGSRALSGARTPEEIAALKDSDGRTLEVIRRSAGFDGDPDSVRLKENYFAAFVELHIEQGPLLERDGIPVGVVTAIAAPAALRMGLEGQGGHAGGVLMADRHDALCAAAEIILAVEVAGRSNSRPDAVATTGVCRVYPGAVNSIPSRVTLEIDVRDIDLALRDRAVATIREAMAKVCGSRGVRADVEFLNADPPAATAGRVTAAIEVGCDKLGITFKRMVSRAYHDSLFMAQICDTGMIFIPCRGGVSHRPDEYAAPDDIRRGVEVLAPDIGQFIGI